MWVKAGAKAPAGFWAMAADRLYRMYIFGDSQTCLPGTVRGISFLCRSVEVDKHGVFPNGNECK